MEKFIIFSRLLVSRGMKCRVSEPENISGGRGGRYEKRKASNETMISACEMISRYDTGGRGGGGGGARNYRPADTVIRPDGYGSPSDAWIDRDSLT